jgi:MoxR-like ATPase
MQLPADIAAVQADIEAQYPVLNTLYAATGRVIVGQRTMLDRLLIGLLTKGHVLLEGMPGLAKTLAIKTLAQAIDAKFSRVQFTPDLLPADLIGTMIYNPAKADFSVRKGPIFANFVLADEINRAPAKVQSALLEAMQERQVTIGTESYKLAEPFLVLATQNPIEQEGTYPLPEAQLDRFLLKVRIGYPGMEEERNILRRHLTDQEEVIKPVLDTKSLLAARQLVQRIYMDEKIESYILSIVFATRQPDSVGLGRLQPLIQYGASPRATIALALTARAVAFLHARAYVIPDDVKEIAHDVLRHRIGLTYEAEAEQITQENIIDQILQATQVP